MNAPAELVVTQEARELAAKSNDALAVSRDFKIVSVAEYQHAGDHLKLVKGLQKQLDDAHRNLKAPALEQCRRIDAFFKEPRDRALQAETVLKRAMLGFQQEQERVRREQEAKAQEAARREQEKLKAKAEKAEAAGKVEKAEALREQAAVIPTPVVAIETPKVSGISTRETWTFEVIDESLIPREYLVRDDRKIGAVVRALKGAANIPGIKAVPVSSIASRA